MEGYVKNALVRLLLKVPTIRVMMLKMHSCQPSWMFWDSPVNFSSVPEGKLYRCPGNAVIVAINTVMYSILHNCIRRGRKHMWLCIVSIEFPRG